MEENVLGGEKKRKKRIFSLAGMIKMVWGSLAKCASSLRLSYTVPRIFTYSACLITLSRAHFLQPWVRDGKLLRWLWALGG